MYQIGVKYGKIWTSHSWLVSLCAFVCTHGFLSRFDSNIICVMRWCYTNGDSDHDFNFRSIYFKCAQSGFPIHTIRIFLFFLLNQFYVYYWILFEYLNELHRKLLSQIIFFSFYHQSILLPTRWLLKDQYCLSFVLEVKLDRVELYHLFVKFVDSRTKSW